MPANGFIAYNGPSEIDGKPIKGIVTGTSKDSANPKTGVMLQLTIMPMASKPSEAIKNGDDASVCGDCVHRPLLAKKAGVAPCYVTPYQKNGIYGAEYPDSGSRNIPLRLGDWGDPAAIPFETIAGLLDNGHTGYTHQWRTCDPRFKAILMASVDSPTEYREATEAGWRTFRVRPESEPIINGEISCPASKEMGNRVQCKDCMLCQGTGRQAKNITIINH
jgi:hypothetical protein